ncbi:CCA tRNA nucleotidyltransferase [Candidatus Pelagibacter sp.]|nr:CCA tRNA nucleotidyltransferase [Candidatus Pelagibacter sp.]
MKALLKKIFQNKKISSDKDLKFLDLKNNKGVNKIFGAINKYNETSEIRYVGGCVRKILNDEKTDDIDLATNLTPDQVKQCLDKNQIKFFETGIEHGTITAVIDDQNFEITTLRKDVKTDGRHAVVEYTTNWKEDSLRRDFSINSIYSDLDGNLYDPNSGHKDLNVGIIKFIGDPETRIKEDYLRIIRYLRFYTEYSKIDHEINIIKIIKKNIEGLGKISKERQFNELKKILKLDNFLKLFKNKTSCELFSLIFPQLKNFKKLSKLSKPQEKILKNKSLNFVISFLVIDETDNSDYFVYKYNLPNELKDKINFLQNNSLNKDSTKIFNKKDLQKIFYYEGKSSTIDLIDFNLLYFKQSKKLSELKTYFEKLDKPEFPIKAQLLINDYGLKEGRELGQKLKNLEMKWIENNFNLSKKDMEKVLSN